MALVFTTSYVEDAKAIFHQYKKLAEGAMAQVTDEGLLANLDPEMNCIAQIVKHMAGNMRSRWTDFLTTDGEKPTRNRDSEFEQPPVSRAELMALWEEGWSCVFSAIDRQVAHYASHCGQIIFMAKHLQSANWKCLSVPRKKSAEFNQKVLAGE